MWTLKKNILSESNNYTVKNFCPSHGFLNWKKKKSSFLFIFFNKKMSWLWNLDSIINTKSLTRKKNILFESKHLNSRPVIMPLWQLCLWDIYMLSFYSHRLTKQGIHFLKYLKKRILLVSNVAFFFSPPPPQINNVISKKFSPFFLHIKTQWKVVSDFTGKKGTFPPPCDPPLFLGKKFFFWIFWKIFKIFFQWNWL